MHACCIYDMPSKISDNSSSVWRPIHHPIEAMPLALCDASSMPEDDLVRADHIRRKFKGETLFTHYSEHHRWYYVSKQTQNEVTLFKNFDSDPHVAAKSMSLSHNSLASSGTDCKARGPRVEQPPSFRDRAC